MQLVVPLSESEIGNVTDGQIATVTVEALEGRKVAAHVSEVAMLSTSSSGAVSYDVTFQLDQCDAGLKLGHERDRRSRRQAGRRRQRAHERDQSRHGDGRARRQAGTQRVVTGLAGNSSTIVLSGLKAGEKVVLPAARARARRSSSRLGRRSSRLGGRSGGLGGGGGGGGGGGLLQGRRLMRWPRPDAAPRRARCRERPLVERARARARPRARAAGHPVIVVRDVSKTYELGQIQVRALRDVSLRIDARRLRGDHGQLRAAARAR